MRHLSALSVLFFCLIGVTHAGSAPDGHSSVKGFFLGFETEAYFAVTQPKEFLDEIDRICKSRKNVWALGIASPFVCTSFTFIEEGGNGPVYGARLESQKAVKSPSHALLFSVRPFPKPEWKVRKPTAGEIGELSSNEGLKDKKYAAALKHLRAGKGQVIEPSNGKMLIYVIPWRVTSDGIVDEQDSLLVSKIETAAYEIRHFRGKVVGLADLNGDGVPELQISTDCDGTCESVVSVVKQAPVRLYISNH